MEGVEGGEEIEGVGEAEVAVDVAVAGEVRVSIEDVFSERLFNIESTLSIMSKRL